MEKFLDEKKAFLFQGVGVELKKNLRLFNENQFKELKKYSSIINSELNIDLWSYIINELTVEIDNESKIERNSEFLEWLLIYTCDYIVYQTYVDKGISPDILVGYSMGLVTAMVCAESISYETGLSLLKNMYIYPEKTKRKDEAMASIIGFDYNDIREIIEEVNLEEYVQIASENSDYCILISGIKNAVCKVMEIAEERGAIKVIKLNASYAFHSRFALEGIDMLYNFVKDMKVNSAKFEIISIFTQDIISEESELKNELITNMFSFMKWKETIIKLGKFGINKFIEVGLNDSLSKISRGIDLNFEFMTYEKIMEFENKKLVSKEG